MEKHHKIYTEKEYHIRKCIEMGLRPCEVDDELCVFHTWGHKDEVKLQMNVRVSEKEIVNIQRNFLYDGVAPAECTIVPVRTTYALVEYPGGAVRKVEAEKVRFLDWGLDV